MRTFASIITTAGARSPSSSPSERATAPLDVASARTPGTCARILALATSQAFGSTRTSGSRCNRLKRSAFSLCVTASTYPSSVGRLGTLRDPGGEQRVDDLVLVAMPLDHRGGSQPWER